MYLDTTQTIQAPKHFASPVIAETQGSQTVKTRYGTAAVEAIKNGPFTFYNVEIGKVYGYGNTLEEAVTHFEGKQKNEILSKQENFTRR